VSWDRWRGCWAAAVCEPPREGAANDALLELFARRLGVPIARLRWTQGRRSRTKLLAVDGLTEKEIEERLGREEGTGSPTSERRRSR